MVREPGGSPTIRSLRVGPGCNQLQFPRSFSISYVVRLDLDLFVDLSLVYFSRVGISFQHTNGRRKRNKYVAPTRKESQSMQETTISAARQCTPQIVVLDGDECLIEIYR
jgi:hypothetical protein